MSGRTFNLGRKITNILHLSHWDIKNSEPGFRVILFDSKNGQLDKTDRIFGCCNKIKFAKELNIDCEIFTLTSQTIKKNENWLQQLITKLT
jgi:hypothetical protein